MERPSVEAALLNGYSILFDFLLEHFLETNPTLPVLYIQSRIQTNELVLGATDTVVFKLSFFFFCFR